MGKGSHRSFFVCLKIGAAWFCPWGLTTFVRSRFRIVGVFFRESMGAEVGRRSARDAGAAGVAGPLSERLCPRLQAAVGPVTAAPAPAPARRPLSRRLRQRAALPCCCVAVPVLNLLVSSLLLLPPFLIPLLEAEVWQTSCEFVALSVVASFVVSSVTVDAATSIKDVLFVRIDVLAI